jgi:hypothetical protein
MLREGSREPGPRGGAAALPCPVGRDLCDSAPSGHHCARGIVAGLRVVKRCRAVDRGRPGVRRRSRRLDPLEVNPAIAVVTGCVTDERRPAASGALPHDMRLACPRSRRAATIALSTMDVGEIVARVQAGSHSPGRLTGLPATRSVDRAAVKVRCALLKVP